MSADGAPTSSSQHKICPECGEKYVRPNGTSNTNWAKRIFCSHRCSGKGGRREGYVAQRDPDDFCECGNEIARFIWIRQFWSTGNRLDQNVGVCDDCLQMWVDDGASIEPPAAPELAGEDGIAKGDEYG